MAKLEISLSPTAIKVINELLSKGFAVEISLVGRRLRIGRVKKSVEYDVMISEER